MDIPTGPLRTKKTNDEKEQQESKSLLKPNLSTKQKYYIKLGLRWWDFLSDILLFVDMWVQGGLGGFDCNQVYGCVAPWIIFFSFLFTITFEFGKSLNAIYALCDNDAATLVGEYSSGMLPSGVDSPFVIFLILMKPNVMADLYRRYDDLVEKDYKMMVGILMIEDIPSILATIFTLGYSGGNFFALFSLLGSIVAAIQTMLQVRKMNTA